MVISTFSHFNTGTISERDAHHITYQQVIPNGMSLASVYPVLPGIEVLELSFSGQRFSPVIHNCKNIVEINYCIKGRCECRMADGCYYYIGEGDVTMNTLHSHSDTIEFPLGHMQGIAVIIDLDADCRIAEHISDVPIDLHQMARRYFDKKESFIIQANKELQHIFASSEIIPTEARNSYYRLKVLELLLFLHYFDPASEKQRKIYVQQQVELVKQVQKRMISQPENRLTISELARDFCISPTALKAAFKGVYGTSIAAYMKQYRIRQSAVLLQQTDMSISDIAQRVGYESQSKFGAVFKQFTGISPSDFRKRFISNIHEDE